MKTENTLIERSRTADVEKSLLDGRCISVAFSSETPVFRGDRYEILSHATGCANLTRLNNGAPLLFNHHADEYLGVVSRGSARIDADGIGRATVIIKEGSEGDAILKDIRAGILTKISFLYRIAESQIENADVADGLPIERVTKWEPLEISLVTIPADDTVGVGRSFNFSQHNITRTMEGKKVINEPEVKTADAHATAHAAETVAEKDAARIYAFADSLKTLPRARKLAEQAVARGSTLEEFRKEVLSAWEEDDKAIPRSIGFSGDFLSAKDARRYSVTKAIRAAAFPNDRRAQEDAAFEREVSEEAARSQANYHGGLIIPGFALARDVLSVSTNAGATPALIGTGDKTVATEVLANEFISLLKNKMSVGSLAQVLTGLRGDIAIPKLASGPSAGWIDENGASPVQSATFEQIKLSPKTISAMMSLSDKLLRQSSLSVDALVSNLLIETVALALDKAVLYGDGTNGAPVGVANQTGIYSADYTGTAPTFAEVVEMESEIAAANADIGVMQYVLPAKMRGAFKTTKKFSTTSADNTIWEPGNTVNGYGAIVSNQVEDGDLFFGVWNQVIAAVWGGTEVLSEREVSNRQVNIAVFHDMDIAVRHAEAFAKLSKATA